MSCDYGRCDLKSVGVRELPDGTLLLSGLAADYKPDRDGESFAQGAFERGLQRYLDTNPIVLYQHDPERPLGRVTAAYIDSAGLHVEMEIPEPPEGSWARHPYLLAKKGILRGLSVGGNFKRVGRVIVDSDLQEISLAAIPVLPGALIGRAAARAEVRALQRAADALQLEVLRREARALRAEQTRRRAAGSLASYGGRAA